MNKVNLNPSYIEGILNLLDAVQDAAPANNFFEYSYRIIEKDGSKSGWIGWWNGQDQLNFLQGIRNEYKTLEWKTVFWANQ